MPNMPSVAGFWIGHFKLLAKSARTASTTAMRGGVAPAFSARPRNSHAASAATAAMASVKSQPGPRKTKSKTNGIRMRAVTTRFIRDEDTLPGRGCASADRLAGSEFRTKRAEDRSSAGALLLKQLRHISLASQLRYIKRRLACVVPSLDIGALVQQQLHILDSAIDGRLNQRSDAVVVLGIEVGAIVQQELHNLGMAPHGRANQHCLAVDLPGFDVRALRQQELHNIGLAISGCPDQRR